MLQIAMLPEKLSPLSFRQGSCCLGFVALGFIQIDLSRLEYFFEFWWQHFFPMTPGAPGGNALATLDHGRRRNRSLFRIGTFDIDFLAALG